MIVDLAEDCAKEPWNLPEAPADQDNCWPGLAAAEDRLRDAYEETVKQARVEKDRRRQGSGDGSIADDDEDIQERAKGMLKTVEKDIVRARYSRYQTAAYRRPRPGNRPIDLAETGILPRAHGSALFTRGETQGLVTATLGTGQDEQIIDALEGEYREHFLLHYNFPPYSVGEASFLRSPGRRGNRPRQARLAGDPGAVAGRRRISTYTMRVVSEITESNGSSSMATVCGTSLSLMDAGVPLRRPCAGIAMGLIKEDDRFAVSVRHSGR